MALKIKSTKPLDVKDTGEKKTPNKISTEENPSKNKHIIFDDDNVNEVVVEKKQKPKEKKSEKNRKNAMDIGTQWYQMVSMFYLF